MMGICPTKSNPWPRKNETRSSVQVGKYEGVNEVGTGLNIISFSS